MTYSQTLNRAWRDVGIGVTLMLLSCPVILVAILKGAYVIGKGGGGTKIASLLMTPAQFAFDHTPLFMAWLWRVTPPFQPHFQSNGLWVVIIFYAISLAGLAFIRGGLKDQARINRLSREAADQRIRNELQGVRRVQTSVVDIQVSQEPRGLFFYFKVCLGQVVLPLALTVAGAALCKWLGLM